MLEVAVAALIAQAPLPTTAAGTVVDAATGAPLSGALVQQDGSVTSAFTKPDGTFRLLLDRTGRTTLKVSAVGYDAVSAPVGDGKAVRVSLRAVSGFVPNLPAGPSAPIGQNPAERAPLHSHIVFGYRIRHQSQDSGAATLAGFVNNDYLLGARFRYRPWLLEAEGGHFETPINVAGLSPNENPAFKPSVWHAGVRGGFLHVFGPDLEGAAALGYRYHNSVPNNADIRYTGSDLDFEQSRHALGPVGTIAWRPGRGLWHFEGSLGLYPIVLASAPTPGAPVGGSFFTDARLSAGYEVVPGLRLAASYRIEDWRGNGGDNSQLLGLQMHYTPGGVPQGSER